MVSINSVIKKSVAIVVLLCSLSMGACAAPDWKLKKNEEGIKVFTASTEASDFKSVKVECTINAKLSQLVAYLLDINQLPNWVYGTKYSRLEKTIAPNELIFYSEINVPWPCSNRDYVAHITVNQTSPDHITIDSHGEPNLIPEKSGKVRVKHSVAHWEVTAISKDQLQVVYTVEFDPSGSVPPWVVNLFLTKGPLQTFQNLRAEVTKPANQHLLAAFIKEAP